MEAGDEAAEKALNEARWNDGANWASLYGRRLWYSASEDSRWVVPKQPLVIAGSELTPGWTLNMAHPTSRAAVFIVLPAVVAVSFALQKRHR
jgi:uncharacterized membrane protein